MLFFCIFILLLYNEVTLCWPLLAAGWRLQRALIDVVQQQRRMSSSLSHQWENSLTWGFIFSNNRPLTKIDLYRALRATGGDWSNVNETQSLQTAATCSQLRESRWIFRTRRSIKGDANCGVAALASSPPCWWSQCSCDGGQTSSWWWDVLSHQGSGSGASSDDSNNPNLWLTFQLHTIRNDIRASVMLEWPCVN